MKLKEHRQRANKGITLPGIFLLLLFAVFVIPFSYTTEAISNIIYVDGDNGSPSSPYSTWGTAADNMGDATTAASIGDTIIVRASTNTYSGFAIPEGTIVQAENVGTEYPAVIGGVTFAVGDYTTNPAVIEGFDIVDNGGTALVVGDADITNTTKIRYNILHGNGEQCIQHTAGTPTIEYNEIYGSTGNFTGISIQGDMGSTSEAMIIRGNNIHNNATAGGSQYNGEIYLKNVNLSYILFQNNHIHTSNGRGGVNITAGEHYLYFTGNEFDNNPFAGVHVSGDNTGQVIFSGEPNFTFPASGPSYTDGSPNLIHNNGRGGISIAYDINMDIISNDIYANAWGAISTDQIDPDLGYPTYLGFSGTPGSAVLDIRKNYIHNNGTALNTIGGGINARQATVNIQNNVIYKNNRAGIRVGDFVTEISNNTVVANGNVTAGMGGGIVYDSSTNLDSMPTGTLASPIPVKNNVIAYNEKAALLGLGFTNTLGSEERDYNLIYSNNPGAWWWTEDCGYVAAGGDYSTELIDFKCLAGQYGFQPLYWDCWQCPGGKTLETEDPGDILDDPVFVSMTTGTEDYQLDTGSPGIGAGESGTDMGAWGGSDPMDWSHGLPH